MSETETKKITGTINVDPSRCNFSIFVCGFKLLERMVHKNAVDHGWHNERPDPNDKRAILNEEGNAFALIHGEVTEAHEAMRHGNGPSEHIPEFSGVEEELADVVIRCMDWAAERNYRLAEAIVAKHEFNKTRPYRHGNKLV